MRDQIGSVVLELEPHATQLLSAAARREARDAAPDAAAAHDAFGEELAAWEERWSGLCQWFTRSGDGPSQAELLRGRARSAIPHLLSAIAAVHDRQSGRSDRSADFRVLATWFAECADEADAHRLYRAAFSLSPARHLALACPSREIPASTPLLDRLRHRCHTIKIDGSSLRAPEN